MFIKNKMKILAVLMAAILPATASNAITVDTVLEADMELSFAEVLKPGETITFNFTAAGTPAFNISDFALTGSGNNSGLDVASVTFGFDLTSDDTFDDISTLGSVAIGFDFLNSNGPLVAGDMFSIIFQDGIEQDVSITLSFNTSSISAVPVPASGLLLGMSLLGAGYAARRKAKKS